MTDAKLKSLAERINRLMDDRDGLSADLRDIYAEAKGVGYIPKALRKVIARMRANEADLAEEETLIELYEAALGRVGKAMAAVRNGATLDDAAAANGIDRATLARARAVAKQSENATPPATALDIPPQPAPVAEECLPHISSPEVAAQAERLGLTAVARILAERHPIDTRTPDEIRGEQPAFLRRVTA